MLHDEKCNISACIFHVLKKKYMHLPYNIDLSSKVKVSISYIGIKRMQPVYNTLKICQKSKLSFEIKRVILYQENHMVETQHPLFNQKKIICP